MRNLILLIMIGVLIITTGCVSTTKTQRKTTAKLEEDINMPARQDVSIVTMSNQEIQIALKNAGYYEGSIDGILGSRSREAIRRFQQDNGLKDDSIAGPKTQEKLKKYINTEYKP